MPRRSRKVLFCWRDAHAQPPSWAARVGRITCGRHEGKEFKCAEENRKQKEARRYAWEESARGSEVFKALNLGEDNNIMRTFGTPNVDPDFCGSPGVFYKTCRT